MSGKAKLEKVLVVLGPGEVGNARPAESALVRRALALAARTGCALELFHVCHDSRFDDSLFADNDAAERERRRLTDRDATTLAAMAATLGKEQVEVRHEVRWDFPRTDAILRKIADSRPDVVMKTASERSYVFGITTNTEWELARRSPAHVWLVNDKIETIRRIVAAIGNRHGDSSNSAAIDEVLLGSARFISDAFEASLYMANAFQVPATMPLAADVSAATVVPPEEQQALRERIINDHSETLRSLARRFAIDTDAVFLREGDATTVIPNIAETVGADIVVMGARSIGRLERLVSSVTVEPVMAEVSGDILIVREDDGSRAARATDPMRGEPAYDIERAMTSPGDVFDSPQQVAELSAVSIGLRKRILQAWEYDIRAEMNAETEGAALADIDVNALGEIAGALETLSATDRSASRREARSGHHTG